MRISQPLRALCLSLSRYRINRLSLLWSMGRVISPPVLRGVQRFRPFPMPRSPVCLLIFGHITPVAWSWCCCRDDVVLPNRSRIRLAGRNRQGPPPRRRNVPPPRALDAASAHRCRSTPARDGYARRNNGSTSGQRSAVATDISACSVARYRFYRLSIDFRHFALLMFLMVKLSPTREPK